MFQFNLRAFCQEGWKLPYNLTSVYQLENIKLSLGKPFGLFFWV